MKLFRKSSTHYVAYIIVFLLVISAIVTLNIFFQQNLNKDIAKQFNNQQLLLARSAALSIEKHIDNYVRHLLAISQLSAIWDVEEASVGRQLVNALLEDVPTEDETIVNLQIVDKNGIVRYGPSKGGLVGMDISGRDYFIKTRQLMKGEVNITNMLHLEELSASKRYIVISTPLMTQAGMFPDNFNGVALFAVSVDDIAGQYVSQIQMGERGYAWVMDSHGMLVYHPTNPEMIGRNLKKADESCHSCHESFDAELKILEGTSMQYGVYTAPMGEDKLISFSKAKVGSESWIVCVTAPFSEVTALIAKSMKLYSWLISVIFFTVIGTSVFFVVLIKKKTEADERAKHAAELEDKVTERTIELSLEKEKQNAILSGFGAGVSLIDRDYYIHWANDVITQNVEDPVRKQCFDAFRKLDAPCEGCPMPAALKTGQIQQAVMVCSKPRRHDSAAGGCVKDDLLSKLTDESTGYFQIVIAPIKDEGGRVNQVVELIQDVTKMKKLEQHMMHSEKLAALGQISAGIAHEIGNPLTSIFSFIQILQDFEHDEFTTEALNTVSFHITRIRDIVQQMSGFSQSCTIEKAPVDLNDCVRSTMELLGHEERMKNCELSVNYNKGRLEVMADSKWLISVFVNLIINALDAMPKDGKLTVNTFLDAPPGGCRSAVCEITDTGHGISPGDIGRIFDPFFTTKQPGKGTGLGLAVSYNIIQDLNGDISVTSQPGEGTTFTVRLPMEECF